MNVSRIFTAILAVTTNVMSGYKRGLLNEPNPPSHFSIKCSGNELTSGNQEISPYKDFVFTCHDGKPGVKFEGKNEINLFQCNGLSAEVHSGERAMKCVGVHADTETHPKNNDRAVWEGKVLEGKVYGDKDVLEISRDPMFEDKIERIGRTYGAVQRKEIQRDTIEGMLPPPPGAIGLNVGFAHLLQNNAMVGLGSLESCRKNQNTNRTTETKTSMSR